MVAPGVAAHPRSCPNCPSRIKMHVWADMRDNAWGSFGVCCRGGGGVGCGACCGWGWCFVCGAWGSCCLCCLVGLVVRLCYVLTRGGHAPPSHEGAASRGPLAPSNRCSNAVGYSNRCSGKNLPKKFSRNLAKGLDFRPVFWLDSLVANTGHQHQRRSTA